MKTFRFKIFISYLVLLLVFLSIMIPFVSNSVQHIVVKSMRDRADELIETITDARDEADLAQAVKDQAYLVFFHVALIDSTLDVLYDSHSKRLLGSHFFKQHKITPDVQSAFDSKEGIVEEFSSLLGQKLVYLSKSFRFQGKKYVLRLAFPQEYIHELKKNFTFGITLFSTILLILFSTITGFILDHFMSPVRQIIRVIKPYQEGRTSYLPEIQVRSYLKDEFSDLAKTFNSLSERIKYQIETLTQERNEKEAILESLTEGVLAVDQKMHISYANSTAIAFLSKRLILPPKCIELLHRCQTHKKTFNDEIQIQLNGSLLHLNIVASPKQDGAILVLQDKSIHYKILEMRKEFIANASHELKTPITIIRGFAETLQDNPELEKAVINDITARIIKNTHRMTKIIQNLLTLADIEQLPQFKLQSCDLHDLIQTCIQTMQISHPKTNVKVEAHPEKCIIKADPELLEVALTNLLDNAAKYSKERPEITVLFDKTASSINLSIKDQGIGIPETDLPHIFERFYTVNKAESKKLGGSGLGLSIVETIVEKHFGKISVESTIGAGSTFTIQLPRSE
ncbi:MAG: hypothetical protein JWO53_765 [Chlamydiia bacterium]|nr:hypothetical protein [Chlamydiia bacterium]